MKKSTKILSLVLVAVVLCMTLASCGKTLSGEYELDATMGGTGVVTTYKFSLNSFTATIVSKVAGMQVGDEVVVEGTYKIDGDTITLEVEDEESDVKSGTFDFKETEDGIKIGLVEYKKK